MQAVAERGRLGRQRVGRRPLAITPTVYWRGAVAVSLVLVALVVVRLQEFFPALSPLRPVLSFSVIGFGLLVYRTSPAVRRNVTDHALSLAVMGYFAVVCLSVPFAIWKGAALDTVKSMVPAMFLFVAFMLCAPTRRTLDRLQLGFVALVLVFAWYLQQFGNSWQGRLLSMSGTLDSNDVASVLAITTPMAIGFLTRAGSGRERIASLLAVLACVLGVIATGSRGGTVALVAGCGVFVLGLENRRRIPVMLFAAIGTGIFWVTAPPEFRYRMLSLRELEYDYNTTSDAGRKEIWKRGRLYFSQNPIIGVGAGNFPYAEGEFKQERGLPGKWSAAHNAYVQAFAELGSLGGGLFVIMLLTGAWLGMRCFVAQPESGRHVLALRARPPPHRPEFLAALAAYGVAAIFLSHAYFPPLLAVLGFIALADRVRANPERDADAEAVEPRAAQVGRRRVRGGGSGSWARINTRGNTPGRLVGGARGGLPARRLAGEGPAHVTPGRPDPVEPPGLA